jgi:carboxypeptidase Taq
MHQQSRSLGRNHAYKKGKAVEDRLTELKTHLAEVHDLYAIRELLDWDQETYMPPGGAAARARQLSTVTRLWHEKRTAPALGRLLDKLLPYAGDLDYDSDEASLIRVARRDYDRVVKVPPAFMAELSGHQAAAYQAWTRARPANDFAAVQPFLEKTLDLSRRYAEYFPGYEHIADPLIDRVDHGLKVSALRVLFAQLREQLVPLVQAIAGQPAADDTCLRGHFREAQQWDFGLEIIERFGYDLQRGRQDRTAHPFTTEFSIDDVRITTRVREDRLGEALFSTLHEAGHGLYEQGVCHGFEATSLAGGTSYGVHESQSRLWENMVGRSRPFWTFYYPRLQRVFPEQLGAVSLDAFYRAINRVEPSLVRTDADEVTYNLHIMLRFELELEMLEGRLAVRDLPDAWRERFKADFGIVPPDDRDGVLQDVHWFSGVIGGRFQSYTLGNVLSAQFFDAALEACPQILGEIEQGRFETLLDWLRENIYQHGRKYTTAELAQRVTGGPLRIEPYIHYLREKYGELYALS